MATRSTAADAVSTSFAPIQRMAPAGEVMNRLQWQPLTSKPEARMLASPSPHYRAERSMAHFIPPKTNNYPFSSRVQNIKMMVPPEKKKTPQADVFVHQSTLQLRELLLNPPPWSKVRGSFFTSLSGLSRYLAGNARYRPGTESIRSHIPKLSRLL